MRNLVFLLILFASPAVPHPIPMQEGWFSQYARAPTDATIKYRQQTGSLPQDLSAYRGVIAVADCSLIGNEAWLRIAGKDDWIPVIIFDCAAADGTLAWMAENNIILELGYYLARDLGVLGRGVRGELAY